MVQIKRLWSLQGFLAPWIILIDGNKVGRLNNGKDINIELEEGEHSLVIQPPDPIGINKMAVNSGLAKVYSLNFKKKRNENLRLTFSAFPWNRTGVKYHGQEIFLNKTKKSGNIINRHKNSEEIETVKILMNKSHLELYEVVSTEEFPIDNSFGSDSIVIEHEFSKTVTNEINIEKAENLTFNIGVNIYNLIKTEIEKNFANRTGVCIGETISKKHSMSFTVKKGEKIKFFIIWKRRSSFEECLLQTGEDQLRVPYKIIHDLTYEIKTEKL